MKRSTKNCDCLKALKYSMFITIALLLFVAPCQGSGADIASRMTDCAQIANDAARLKCFDNLIGKRLPMPAAEPPPVSASAEEVKKETVQDISTPSVMSRQWELDPKSRKSAPLIRLHRSNYFLPVAYNSSPNQDPILDDARNARAQNTEAKFQISFKVKLLEDILNKDVDLWFGYTQLAFWQIYNSAFSSPFREVNYEPELLLNFRTNYDILGLKGRIINLGLNHQSNGRSDPLSRSWNRVVANFGFERDNFNLLLKTWYRIPESRSDDDNPDISEYMGYGELWGFYYWKKHRFAAMVRNNLRSSNKGAVQLDWSFPFPFLKNDRFSGYIQFFNGYGESLIDYNKSVNRISFGFMLTDWR
ncbi:MAG: phospholipase [Syntrophus sp. (in: bacteria)]|nr:phospholipase [Syntrophus sp. (in: bacteria)]